MRRIRGLRAVWLLLTAFAMLAMSLVVSSPAEAAMALEDPPVITVDLVQPVNPSLRAITIAENPYWGTSYPPQYYTYGVTIDPLALTPNDPTFDTVTGTVTLDLTGYDPNVDWYVMASLTTDRSGFTYTTPWSAPVIVAGPDSATAPLPDPTPTPDPTPDPTPQPTPKLNWVALGDSFSSGEGVEPFIDGTNIRGDQCHRSTLSYSEDIVAANPDKYSLEFRACSGAVFSDLYNPNHSNRLEATPQLSWVKADTDIVTLTIGGNDAHFADVMRYCVTRNQFKRTCEKEWSARVDKAIAGLKSKYENAVFNIRLKAPNAKIYILGYPRFFPINPPKNCSTGFASFVFSQSDMSWINREIQSMNSVAAAGSTGATFVDTYNMVGSSHDMCSASSWLNLANISHSVYSFHPNAAGQKAYSQALLAAIG